jgi:hypothetical protein
MMKQLFSVIFINNWQRKILALLFAVMIWVLVDHSIMMTKTFPNVPIKVVNLPPNKTIEDYLSDGILIRRLTLTLTGSKAVLEILQSSDLEVVIDAAGKGDDWIVQLSKKDIHSLNPEVDLLADLTDVSHQELFIRLELLVTEQVPVYIRTPIGEPPAGYQFLDIWPRELFYKATGPERQVKKLKKKGVELTFNFNEISEGDLNTLNAVHQGGEEDEITFYIPEQWKKIPIPFLNYQLEPLNDPEAKFLHIDFLRNSLLPIEQEVPIRMFFPLEYSLTMNPDTFSLASNDFVNKKNGIKVITQPLYVENVSRLFLDVVQGSIEVVIVATPKSEAATLPWNIQFVNQKSLEQDYVDLLLASEFKEERKGMFNQNVDVNYLRERFRNYLRKFSLFDSTGREVTIEPKLHGSVILVDEKKQMIVNDD